MMDSMLWIRLTHGQKIRRIIKSSIYCIYFSVFAVDIRLLLEDMRDPQRVIPLLQGLHR